MSTVDLNCWVQGDDPNRIFGVEIATTETVGDLRNAIKEEKKNGFRDIDAKMLVLWKVFLPFDDEFDEKLEKLDLGDVRPLMPWLKLSSVFLDQPTDDYLIVIKRPVVSYRSVDSKSRLLELNCLVLGDDHRRVFPVEIAAAKTVGHLKKVIKEKKKIAFRDIEADMLVLWRISIPADGNLKKTLDSLELADGDSLDPMDGLWEVFSGGCTEKHVLIFVAVSSFRLSPSSYRSLADTQGARRAFFDRNSAKSPSEQGQANEFAKGQHSKTFYFNRPPAAAATIPLPLLHPAFGQFVDDCESYIPTREDNRLVHDLSYAMSGFFSSMSQFREVMNAHGFDITTSSTEGTSYWTNGGTIVGEFYTLVVEGKPEISESGAEPLFQGACYYLESVRTKARESNHTLPCFILYVLGAHLGFAGAAFTDRPNLQVLTTPLPLFFHNSDTKMRMLAARQLGALKRAIDRLRPYYEVDVLSKDVPDPMFPYPTRYVSLHDQTERKFAYVSSVPEKLIFFGRTDKNEDICIKFVRSYSKDAHLHVASMGCAPVLRGFESVPGGWFMVVMDVLDESYQPFHQLLPGPGLYGSVMEMVVSLHQKGFVHGDIRDTNLWVNEGSPSKFMLVDFDWSGEIGQVRYPMNVYEGPDLRRPKGAYDGELIVAEHDVGMVKIMFNM